MSKTYEVCVDLNDFNNYYKVSNLGIIYSKERFVNNVGKTKTLRKEKPLKPSLNREGYPIVALFRNKHKVTVYIHRIVCQAFIPNPENKPEVNHKNGIKTDNRVENLEWTTKSENVKHSFDVLKKKANLRSIPTMAINLKTGEQQIFNSRKDASICLNIHHKYVNMIANNKKKPYKNYLFKNIKNEAKNIYPS